MSWNTIAALAAGAMIAGTGAAMAQAPGGQAASGAHAEMGDPFLWLEDIDGARALDWARKENKRSLGELQGDARYQPMVDAAKAILNSDARIPYVSLRGGYVYNFWQDAEHVRGLWRRATLESYFTDAPQWDVILDVDALAKDEDENWVYEGASCLAPDYDRCMVGLSRGGSDASVWREFRISDKAFVKGGFELPEGKSGVAWVDANTLLVGADTGGDSVTTSGYPRTPRLWRRGDALADSAVVLEGEKSDVGVWPFSEYADGKMYSGIVRALTFFDSETYLRTDDGLKKLPLPAKSSLDGVIDGRAIVSLQEDWTYDGATYPSGSVAALDLATLKAEPVFAPGDRQAVSAVSLGTSAVYVTLLDNIVGKVKKLVRGPDGWAASTIALPGNGVVSVSGVNAGGDDFFVNFESPTTPDSLYYVSASGVPKVAKQTPAFYDATGVVVEQREATSKDGTKVPYFVIGKKDVIEAGNAPVIQYGYGGFQVSILPNYSAITGKLWIEHGGVYVIANIRGGGEFGPAWHQAALKEHRQRAYDDFFAVSEDMIASGLTSTEHLGALGGSNGGLLMGVAFTERPDLYTAIGCGVPLLDMIRYTKLGAGASWIGEYGDPDIPEERAYILKYSPYQNLKKGVDYPRVFFFTSTKDDRVHPGHARKMAAKMESYGEPFLYYENIEGGHAASANQNQRAVRSALQFVYFSRQLMDE